jgi:hypothetical protein
MDLQNVERQKATREAEQSRLVRSFCCPQDLTGCAHTWLMNPYTKTGNIIILFGRSSSEEGSFSVAEFEIIHVLLSLY